jgi:hypothetical protein
MAQLKAFHAVQPINTLTINLPAFTEQQNVQPQVAKARTSGSELFEPDPQSYLFITAVSVALT